LLFSIIIPTYQRNDLLALCLQRLQPGAQTLEPNLYEVIVTDDAADPANQQLLHSQFPWATYTAGPQRGPAANRNHGATLARGQWLVFTDDDCLPDANWLQAYANAIAQHPNTKAFEGAILPDDWALLKKDMAECPVNTTGGCFWSANIMVANSLFQQVGGFDEQFTIAAQEDQDLQWRIQQQHIILFVPAAKVVHPVRFRKVFIAVKEAQLRATNYTKFALKIQLFGNKTTLSNVYWRGGILPQFFFMIASIKQLKFRQLFVAFYTMIFVYLPKWVQSIFN
jgi:GT2 family glycosyltransferase